MRGGSGATHVRPFRDPWPSPQSAWNDPPWILEGRVVTAWFFVDRDVVAKFISPDLLPRGADAKIRTRIRFYDVNFSGQNANSAEPFAGRFREAVVAFASSVGSVDGEVSLFMWTDNDTYMLWGREIFGWPLERAEFDFEGTLWSAGAFGRSPAAQVQGESAARSRDCGLGLRISEAFPSGPGLSAATWITPRRVLRRAGLDPETREILLVRPEILDPGRKFEARGDAWLTFPSGHALAGTPVDAPSFEIVDGFRIRVGADVSVVAEPIDTEMQR